VRVEILMAVVINVMVFLVVLLYDLIQGYQLSEEPAASIFNVEHEGKQVPPKYWHPSTNLHSVAYQKTTTTHTRRP
jgi:hypothetical protein